MALRPEATLDKFVNRGAGRLPGLIGIRFTEIAENRIGAELDIRDELLAPNGYLHAATVIALADTACGYGCIAHLPPGAENFTTIELKSNFLGTARDGTSSALRRPRISAGRRRCGMRWSPRGPAGGELRCFAARS
jgi:uncharacterized protein (TIGR00369 family)